MNSHIKVTTHFLTLSILSGSFLSDRGSYCEGADGSKYGDGDESFGDGEGNGGADTEYAEGDPVRDMFEPCAGCTTYRPRRFDPHGDGIGDGYDMQESP